MIPPIVLTLLPDLISLGRFLAERYGGNSAAARAAIRRIRDEWDEWEAAKTSHRAELERVLARRATFDDLAQRAGTADPIPDHPTPAETPGAKKGRT